MRREIFHMSRPRALELLARAPFVHLATTNAAGDPVLRTVHGVIAGDHLCFHGAPAGEKMESLGRPAVVSAEEVVAEIPSWFTDAERACPATTLYESVQLHGVLEAVDDPIFKAQALQALMQRYQPEGRHVPITADHPLYAKAVEGILIVRVSLERLDGKSKLGQNRPPEVVAQVIDALWRRGRAEDVRAIERVRSANPAAPPPAFLAAPEGLTLALCPQERDARAAAHLLEGTYWNIGQSPDTLRPAPLGTAAWVVAHDSEGALAGTARALSDGAKCAWIFDVMVAPAWRRRGVAGCLLRLLLDHPLVRGATVVRLNTRDAEALYRPFGFQVTHVDPTGRIEMLLRR